MRRRLFLPVLIPLLLPQAALAQSPPQASPQSGAASGAASAADSNGASGAKPAAAPSAAAPQSTATGLAAQAALPGAGAVNDYPTAARADYVFACMSVNGGSREALDHCSCSIDVIASILPYARYEKAETVLSMRQGLVGGYLGEEFRQSEANDIVRALKEAQAEAEVRCF
ncbi:hypothetical protein [Acidisphaera rubrifaciens]|uniref:Uncharacterized protein n=1 Tax=Acidisphaera rubrifaciens HS-AP3 TaxID=1231350 RepID=A0A0D6PA93_9PROT|nr:hypothetical protein [Acidisphaera rubrifaciens]GAN78281.1 hypothetical protein Asru_0723_03 [Acidisphaera rubrifaciens HS-AP3]